MSKSYLRVVFDSNVFSEPHFAVLANSSLVRLCEIGRIVPVYGHVLLEEVFKSYGHENKRQALVNDWMPFIAKTVHRFRDDFVTIWHRELVQGHGRKTNTFMKPDMQRSVLAAMSHVPMDGSWRAFHGSKADRDVDNAKRAAQRDVSVDIRQTVAKQLKAAGYNKQQHGGPVPFDEFCAREMDATGRMFIEAQVPCVNPHAVADRWVRNKAAYPYFTTFVRNMIYIGYFSATRPNDKIDLNAQADLDLMTHLIHADAVVTNETDFMRKAFEDLWRPRGKVIFTSQEFADFIEKL